ncbi:hypothetical protein Hypma_002064 [Hypsizygus marmoreus]|uniref:Protein kinase domain-containing protein n=1 Tax=Hypsizygus marmoreus TaxID=39966 RepID=A0A369J6I6_HYPMA|nr:hypothetical protein Hypma_002064 [Hypsizygus marmoreus]
MGKAGSMGKNMFCLSILNRKALCVKESRSSATSPTRAILQCLRASSPLIPVPGLGPALGIVISILEIVESVKMMKKDCQLLAERAAQLVLSIHLEFLDAETSVPSHVVDNVGSLLRVLGDIQVFASTIVESRWIKHFWKRDSIQEKLQEFSLRLEDCFQTFQIKSLIRVQHVLSQLKDGQDITFDRLHREISAFQKATTEISTARHDELLGGLKTVGATITLSEIQRNADAKQTRSLLKNLQCQIDGVARPDNGARSMVIAQRELILDHVFLSRAGNHSGIFLATHRDETVLVKKFGKDIKAFLRECAIWREIWHPHLPQLIGHSPPSDANQFLVLRGVVSRDVAAYLQSTLSGGKAAGFLAGLDILHGITSAISYLRHECNFTKNELGECLKASNLLLSGQNHVMIGENLLLRPPHMIADTQDEAKVDLFLADEFWYLTRNLTCASYDPTNWKVVSGQDSSSSLRSLLHFSSFGPQGTTMSDITRKITQAWTQL